MHEAVANGARTRRARRVPAILLALASLTPLGCGARSAVDLLDYETTDRTTDGGSGDDSWDAGGDDAMTSDDGSPPPGADGGTTDAPGGSAPVGDGGASNSSACGAPWVVFILTMPDLDGLTSTQVLYARRSDGTDGHAISLPNDNPSFPWISADGAVLVYTTNSGGKLYLHYFATGADSEVSVPSGVVGGFAALSPDGSALAYSSTAGLQLAPLDTSLPARTLVPNSGATLLGDSPAFPSFTADSRQVLFGTHTAIGSIEVNGSSLGPVIQNPGGFVGVDNVGFSPDQQSVVAGVACPLGTYSLRVYPFASLPVADCASGTVVTTLDPPGAIPFYPTWGPGGLIAYWNGNSDVMLVSAEGGTPVNFTQDLTAANMMEATMPAWAPACTVL